MHALLILSNASGYGGAERNLEAIVSALAHRYRMIICVENDAHRARLSTRAPASVTIVPFRKGKGPGVTFSNLRVLRGWLHSVHPIAVIANSNKGAFYLALHEAAFGPTVVRKILFAHDFQWRFVSFIYHVLKDATTVIPTPALLEKQNYIARFLPRRNEKESSDPSVIVFPNLVPAFARPRERPENDKPDRAREYVLCLATIAPLKGLKLLIEAFRTVAATQPHIDLRICGDVADKRYASEALSLITRFGLDGRVRVEKFRDDVAELYEGALFVVNSSISRYGGPESFGRTIIEAWHFRKAVIAFCAGGPKYLIDDGRDGFLVLEGDVVELGRRMLQLARDAQLRVHMGTSGYNKAQSRFSMHRLVPQLSGLLEGNPGSAQLP